MFDLPETTTVAVGLATKPYPPFRLPGLNRYSVAYHSSGEKSHNYPFTAQPFGPLLKEGDVLGVGYRPRTGTVFYTRNGRKMEDAFVGLSRWNLFPTIGADGPCSVHVNLGQAGFVFIEANVKKWGLAPSVGTLAPPPAYGSERGSILLDVGGRRVNPDGSTSSSPSSPNRHRSRRPRHSAIGVSSPLRTSYLSEPPTPLTPPPPITPIDEGTDEDLDDDDDDPSDDPSAPLLNSSINRSNNTRNTQTRRGGTASRSTSPISANTPRAHDAGARNPFTNHRHTLSSSSLTHFGQTLSVPGRPTSAASSPSPLSSELTVQLLPPPDSPMSPNMNPPTPGQRDIHLQALAPGHHRRSSSSSNAAAAMALAQVPSFEESTSNTPTPTGSPATTPTSADRLLPSDAPLSRRDPPAYSPLDAYTYAEGVHIDLPAEVIAAALEGGSVPHSAVGQSSNSGSNARPGGGRRSSRRR